MPQSTSLAPSSLAVSRQDTPQGQGAQLPHRPAAARAAAARAAAAYRAAAPCWRQGGPAPRAAGCGTPSPARKGSGCASRRTGGWQQAHRAGSGGHASWRTQAATAGVPAGRQAGGRAGATPGRGAQRGGQHSIIPFHYPHQSHQMCTPGGQGAHLPGRGVEHREVELVVAGAQVRKHVKHGWGVGGVGGVGGARQTRLNEKARVGWWWGWVQAG